MRLSPPASRSAGTIRRAGLAALFLPVVLAASMSRAEPPAAVVLRAESGTPARQIPLAELRARPPTSLDVRFLTSRGEEAARYTGAALWPLLVAEGLVDPDTHKGLLRRVVIVTGADGYAVALSAGELSPDFGGTPAFLAYERDGAPLEKGLRLIVPGDHRGGRNVGDVARIDITTVETPP